MRRLAVTSYTDSILVYGVQCRLGDTSWCWPCPDQTDRAQYHRAIEVQMSHCEVVEMRNSADAVGYLCSRTASTQCSDCGSEKFRRCSRSHFPSFESGA